MHSTGASNIKHLIVRCTGAFCLEVLTSLFDLGILTLFNKQFNILGYRFVVIDSVYHLIFSTNM